MRKLYTGFLCLVGIFLALWGQAQTTYSFTTAGASGRQGPTQVQIDAAYSAGNTLHGKVTITTQGIQVWTVPSTGLYAITAAGASGGYTPNAVGGKGRVITTHIELTAGQIIQVLVGQEGGRAHFVTGYVGGGGGGSFVVDKTSNAPILIAGGGGGAGEGNTTSYIAKLAGVDASQENISNGQNGIGFSGSWSSPGVGGTNGSGGTSFSGGSGGGGFTGNGSQGNYGGYSGTAFVNGGEGGANRSVCGAVTLNVDGGFGGGAGAGTCTSYEANGGGGGGYSGGGGSNTRVGAGGGGGNYITGTYISSELNTGHGYVTIVRLFNGGTVDADQTFCGSGTPALFASTAPASGSPVAGYQWQVSTDNSNWSDVNGETDLSYQSPVIYQTTYYRRKAIATDASIAYSNTITVTVNPIPAFNATGFNKTICANENVSLDLTTGGNVAGATYSWTNDNPAIGLAASGSNIISFTSVNAGAANLSSTITVTPTAAGCTGTSQVFTIMVKPTPTVNAVNSQVLCHNTNTTAVDFSGAVTGTTYSWTNSDPSIGLAASGTGSIPAFTAINTGNSPITATITITPEAGACTGVQESFTFTVNPLPQATISGGSFCKTGMQQLDVTNGLIGGTFSAPAGLAISASGLIDLEASTAGTYTVTYTFSNGTCENVTTSSVEVKELTQISTQPVSQTVCDGAAVSFNVAATGEGILTYQWRKNGNAIAGATAATYIVSNATTADAGDYEVVVAGACGNVTSAAATLVVNSIPDVPVVTTNSVTTFCQGESVTLTSSAVAGNQWFKDGVAINGATAQTYVATTSGNYTVQATQNNCTSSSSAAVAVAVKPLPVTPVISATGNVLTSTATANNQWYLNGTAINGATGITHRVQASGLYTVEVTLDGCKSLSNEYNFVATRIADPATWNGELTIYPNPVQKVLFIKNPTGRKLQVQLFDGFGKKVYGCQLATSTGAISVEKWASGVYQLIITDINRNETVSQTLIKL